MTSTFPIGTYSQKSGNDKNTYFAVLQGRTADMHLLGHYFTVDACKVIRDTAGDRFLLRSTKLELAPAWRNYISPFGGEWEIDGNESKVRDMAENLVVMMNGAVALSTSGYIPVAVGFIDWDERTTDLCVTSDSLAAHALPRFDSPLIPLLPRWVLAGTLNEKVRIALSILASQPIGWTSLYLVYEMAKQVICTFPTTWITDRDVKKFTATANNSRVLADGMRHAKAVDVNWDPTHAISLEEARKIIFKLMRGWIEQVLAPPR
jgi:hypothetical protein